MNPRKIALCMAIGAILCSPTSHAAEGIPAYGAGALPCGEFSKAYAQNPTLVENIYFTWAQGFMSALNIANVAIIHVYRDINRDGVLAHKEHIRTFCDNHPMVQYMAAVMDLYNTFPPRQEKQN